MDDLISRQDVINEITEVKERILDMPIFKRWIPCSERLPQQIGDYLITVRQSYNDSIWYDTDVATFEGSWVTFNDWDEGFGFDVVAWCDLPEPYKGENDE